uniref:Mesoderm posterior bb n=1 Tax=Myripristis murdjan TaxID=586833 RepID=A0A667WPH7_9TELE
MDTSSVPLLDYSLQYQWCSDSDLSSISSPETLSPVPSMDSSLSPSYQQPVESTLKSPSRSIRKPGRARMPRIRSKQRESASEKEKLRMRDLTKALHHLRTYLPPSVAPAGQTLTKIETLRLTIRYISYLSAQLGLSEEVLFQRREQGDRSTSDSLSHNHGQYQAQCQSQPASLHSGSCSFGVDLRQYSGQYSEASQGDILTASMDTILQSPPATHPSSCQMYGKDFCTPLVPREYWG